MKIDERGKFKPAVDYSINDVKKILYDEIGEEKNLEVDCDLGYDLDDLDYKNEKFNLISLFSGCGSLDLGFELAGLKAVMGKKI